MLETTANDPAPFASVNAIVSRALQSYLPAEAISVADHAARNRWLFNTGGGFVGRWNNEEAPYLIEIMEALTDPDYQTVVVPKPARCGGTAIAENWLLQSVDTDPADMLWYEPTDDVLEAYVKKVINEKLIDQHDILKLKLGRKPIDNSLHFKSFTTGMNVEFLAMTANALKNKSASRIVGDEIDAAPESLGDVFELLDQRRQTFGLGSKVYVTSHPDQATGLDPKGWVRGIMGIYAKSIRKVWYWPCPECNDFSSPHPLGQRVMDLHYPDDAPLDEIRDATTLLCPSCGSLIADAHRRTMNLDGKWVGLGQTIAPDGTVEGTLVKRPIYGAHIVGAMSPFIIGGIGTLAAAKVEAERNMLTTLDDKPLRLVMARRWGLPYEPRKRSGQIDAQALAERAEDRPLRQVPDGVRFLTCFVDVQPNRFDVMTRGWGVGGESWIVDARQIPADTAVSGAAWDDLIAMLTNGAYPLADGSQRAMRLRGIGIDSAGAAGTTQQANSAWRRAKTARTVRYFGKADGRDVFNLMLTKGASTKAQWRLQVVYPTSKRKDRDARAAGEVPVLFFQPNAFKDDLAGQLAITEPGPWHIHHPAALRGEWPHADREGADPAKHRWFDQVVAERPDAHGRWARTIANAPNEALDQHVGTHVLAELHGLARIKWDKPPPWAETWDKNVLIGPVSTVPTGAGTGGTAMAPVTSPRSFSAPDHRKTAADRLDRIASMLR